MRILFAADVRPNPNSGASGTEFQTIRALRELGHEVDTIWADDLPHRIRNGNLHYLLELPRAYRDAIRRKCADRTYDVFHVNQPYAWLAAKDRQQSRRRGVFVNRSHGWEARVAEVLRPWWKAYRIARWRFPRGLFGRPVQWLLAPYPARAARYSDGIIVSCAECADFVRRRYHLPDWRVACIPQAPPDAYVQKPAPPMTAERLRRVLYVGQFAFVKGPHVLAEVFGRLAAAEPGIEMTWCCAEQDHAQARALLPEEARRRVHFTDWRSQEQLLELYDQHGVFLFPSFFEGFGKAFLEAMARGLCVVASDTGGMRDLIANGVDGSLVSVGSAKEMVGSVLKLLTPAGSAAEMGQRARQKAASHTWERVAQETECFYRVLLARIGQDECTQ